MRLNTLKTIPNKKVRTLVFDEIDMFDNDECITEDGAVINFYRIGDLEHKEVIIVNPPGSPVTISLRLARFLSPYYRVIVCDSRDATSDPELFCRSKIDINTLSNDLVQAVKYLSGSTAPIIGICAGASLVVKAISDGKISPKSCLLVNPGINIELPYRNSLFKEVSESFFLKIADGNEKAISDYLSLVSNTNNHQYESIEDEIISSVSRLSLLSESEVRVYSVLYKTLLDSPMDEILKSLKTKVHIYSFEDDEIISTDQVDKIHMLLPDSSLTKISSGGHNGVYTSKILHENIKEKLLSIENNH